MEKAQVPLPSQANCLLLAFFPLRMKLSKTKTDRDRSSVIGDDAKKLTDYGSQITENWWR